MSKRERTCAVSARRFVCAGIVAFLFTSCGLDGTGGVTSASEIHACDVLPGIEISRIVGGSLIRSDVDVERNAGDSAFSQCTHTLDGSHRRVTVQVHRSSERTETSRQADADKERARDDGTGYGIQYAEAIEAGRAISGLGDLAYAFEFGGTLHVVAYWGKQFGVRVWMSVGTDSEEQVLQIAKEIVQEVMNQL